MIIKLAHSLVHGWRIGGENETLPFGHKLCFIDKPTYKNLVLVEASAKHLMEEVQKSEEVIIIADARLSHRHSRPAVLGLAQEDASEILKGDVEATDEAADADLDAKLQYLRITCTRCTALNAVCANLLSDDMSWKGARNITLAGLLPEKSRKTFGRVKNELNECVQRMIKANIQSVREYDEYAHSMGWSDLEHAAKIGADLTRNADKEMVRRCEAWVVDAG